MSNKVNTISMKPRIFLVTSAIIMGLAFISCEQDAPKPEIDLTELGYENSKIGYVGSDLHINSEIVAEGTIDLVTIEIHPEGEHKKSTSVSLDEDGWEYDSAYTEFSGLKNTTFHKHVDISMHAEPGHYDFHFIVTDREGRQSSVEEELEIQVPEDLVIPEISISSPPVNNQEFARGETISISGSVSDDQALGGMYIALVHTDQNLSDSEVIASNTISLLHTHDFDSQTAHDFSASIVVGAAQDNDMTPKDITGDIAWQSASYYILVKCKDAFGGNWTFSDQYPVVINY